jgi:hypothetical protein
MRAHASVASIAFLLVACGGSDGGGGPDLGADSTVDSGSSSDGPIDSVGFDLPSTGDADAGALGCSADLHAVIDATGKVVTPCPADKGCAKGACIDACSAAAESKGNVGCDFRLPTPPNYPPVKAPCFAAFIANTWGLPATITVERGGTTYDITKFARIPEAGVKEALWKAVPATGIPVDQVAVLFLSGDPTAIFVETGESMKCPVPTAIDASTVVAGSGKGQAFHITTSFPVSAYDILPYGGATTHFPGAELLFPVGAWGKNYVAIGTMKGTDPTYGPLFTQIVAQADGTKIDLLPTVDLPASGGFPAAPKGVKASFTLNAGEYLQWEASSLDTSGTVVLADKDVALFTGSRFFRYQPVSAPGGESTHQQNVPVSSLASEYLAPPYETRRKDLAPEDITYRLVGAIDGTTLTFDPAVTGAPTKIDAGQVIDFITPLAFEVKSQDASHPFSIAQVMPTSNLAGGTRPGATAPSYPPNLGDEEFVLLLPPAQYLRKYVFFTDPTYPTTNLALTRVKGKDGFKDVSIDCLGTITGWKDVGAGGTYQVTTIDLLRAGVSVKTCQNGRHVAESEGQFGVMVWGLDSYSSYAYPGGGTAAQLTTVTVSPVPK